MTLADICGILKQTGYPVIYHHFTVDDKNPPPVPPYIVYLIPYSTNFGADNRVYQKINHCQVELYTELKDPAVEKALEDILDEVPFFYEKTEIFIDSEKLYQIIYEISI